MGKRRDEMIKEIELLMHTTSCITAFQTAVIKTLRATITFQGVCFTTVDPYTLLSTGAYTDERIERIHHQLFMNEYGEQDYNRHEELVKYVPHVASLSKATCGNLMKSKRYRNVLKFAGLGDELRVAFVYKRKCWGFLSLFRNEDEPFFSDEDCTYLISIMPAIAKVLRVKSVMLPITKEWSMIKTGMIVVNDYFQPLFLNKGGEEWLSRLQKWEGLQEGDLPRSVRAVCSRVASPNTLGDVAKICMYTPDRQIVMIKASKMSGDHNQVCYTVSFERAQQEDIFHLLAEGYDFSVREKQVVERVMKGESTKQIAIYLNMSTYTVQDHLKSIFAKVGIGSRNELVWELFLKHSILDEVE